VLSLDGLVVEAAPAASAPVADPAAGADARPEDGAAGFHQPARSATAPSEAGPREREMENRRDGGRRDGGRDGGRGERRRDDRPRDDRPREERPRDDRPREERPRDDQPREERPRDDRPREERPRDHGQGGHYNRTVPASVAPTLPLVMQQAEELAARPKSETFRALGLNDQIIADLASMGFNAPTPIQSEGIPVAISGKDMIGQAQTGTGKTAAFVLPMLHRLYQLEGEGPVALVLTPTRELAKQVHDAFCKMAGESGARAALVYGGVSMDDQFDALDRKPHVIIGTPGRIIDHMKRRTIDLSRLAIAVLDEADQMLDIGFWPDVMWIMSHTPPARQTLLFSATFPDPIRTMAEKHMRDPVHVRIKPAQVTVEQVDQKYIAVAHDRKTSLLAHFIETQNPEQLVVFCRTKHQTDRVAEVLKRKNLSAGAIHGDLPQNKRERMLQDFRNRDLQCLIATNVAARGLDIPSVSHVVNYDIPENPEEYVHRIGRTARNGARGVARTFITPEDGQFLLEIEKHIGLELEEEEIEGFTTHAKGATEVKRPIADMAVGTPRLLKPLVGGIRLGRRR
jgi:ATP-dependent RNA helicase DeaD